MKVRIIVEGPSERAYMQRLISFLGSDMPLDEDEFSPRLIFYPRVTNNNIGGGSYSLVRKAYRDESRRNSKCQLMIWVDRDIYVRNSNRYERASAAGYAKKESMPDFHFSVMNFEDFLALHFEEETFAQWKIAFDKQRHFVTPLHSEEYDRLWQPVWTAFLNRHPEVGSGAYRKGSLPEGFITVDSLRNLCNNIADAGMSRLFVQHSSPSAPAFPVWFADVLRRIYPEEFS